MIIRTTGIDEVRAYTKLWKSEGKKIGLVPTMGFLHDEHRQLISKAVAENDIVIVSDFVNPLQFETTQDYKAYPRDLEADCKICQEAGAAMVFHPCPQDMVDGLKVTVKVGSEYSGSWGPVKGAFVDGLCTVMLKLINIAQADRVYLGENDPLRLAAVRKMVFDLAVATEVVAVEAVRDENGLVVSATTGEMTAEEKKAALSIVRAIEAGKMAAAEGASAGEIKMAMETEIMTEPLAKVHAIQVLDYRTLKPVEKIEDDVIVTLSVEIGDNILEDNFIYTM